MFEDRGNGFAKEGSTSEVAKEGWPPPGRWRLRFSAGALAALHAHRQRTKHGPAIAPRALHRMENRLVECSI